MKHRDLKKIHLMRLPRTSHFQISYQPKYKIKYKGQGRINNAYNEILLLVHKKKKRRKKMII